MPTYALQHRFCGIYRARCQFWIRIWLRGTRGRAGSVGWVAAATVHLPVVQVDYTRTRRLVYGWIGRYTLAITDDIARLPPPTTTSLRTAAYARPHFATHHIRRARAHPLHLTPTHTLLVRTTHLYAHTPPPLPTTPYFTTALVHLV